MNSSFISKYKPAIILTLALAVFLASCKPPTTTPGKSWVVTTLAGSGTAGDKNGTGTAAEFDSPTGVAVDSSGILYVADTGNHRIRKITSAGVVTIFAGSGEAGYNPEDATGEAAQFDHPRGVAVDSSGNVYVADEKNHRIRKITSGKVVTTFAGTGTAGFVDTDADSNVAAQFHNPYGVAVDSDNNVYVADASNRRIRKITPGRVVTTFAGSGSPGYDNGAGTVAKFWSPYDVAVDSSGNVYVADFGNQRIRKITPGKVVSTFAGSTHGYHNATGTAAQFRNPTGVDVDSSGNVYVADYNNHRIRKITSAKEVTTLAGSGTAGFANGASTKAQFNIPFSVAVDSDNNIYVADTDNQRIRKITSAGGVSTFAGDAAEFHNPTGVAVDSSGNVYVVDMGNHRIRKITSAGGVSTFAGDAAEFNYPTDVAVDSSGNVYVADTGNHRIRKITPEPERKVTTLAGSGKAGHHDANGTAAQFYYPWGVAVDSDDNVYVVDRYNHRIRKITPEPERKVTTLAGSGKAGFKNGPGAVARFNYPTGVDVDSSGNVYVADAENHRIRKITPTGVVSTLAGITEIPEGKVDTAGFADGAGTTAQFDSPLDVAVDSSGNVYVADAKNHRIRKIEYK